MRSKHYTCDCGATIEAVGPKTTHAAALRRVDWKLEGGKATCRTCIARSSGEKVPGLIETAPLNDVFGAKLHRSNCRAAQRALFKWSVSVERARRLTTCLLCKPEVP